MDRGFQLEAIYRNTKEASPNNKSVHGKCHTRLGHGRTTNKLCNGDSIKAFFKVKVKTQSAK